jgi:hypothetical protein
LKLYSAMQLHYSFWLLERENIFEVLRKNENISQFNMKSPQCNEKQKILLVGGCYPAKAAVASAVARCSSFEIVTEQTDEQKIEVVIYCEDQPDLLIIDNLRKIAKILVLIASVDVCSDLFLTIKPFQTQGSIPALLEQIYRLKDFLENKADLIPNLTDRQKKVLCSYCAYRPLAQSLSELKMGRTMFFDTLTELRCVFSVRENHELRQKFTAATLDLLSQ